MEVNKLMSTLCLNCDQPFVAKRKTAKFCSNKCKQEHKRKDKPAVIQPITTIKDAVHAVQSVTTTVKSNKPANRESDYLKQRRLSKLKIKS